MLTNTDTKTTQVARGALRLSKATVRRFAGLNGEGDRRAKGGEAFDSEYTTCSTFSCTGGTGWCQCCSECLTC